MVMPFKDPEPPGEECYNYDLDDISFNIEAVIRAGLAISHRKLCIRKLLKYMHKQGWIHGFNKEIHPMHQVRKRAMRLLQQRGFQCHYGGTNREFVLAKLKGIENEHD